MYICQASGVCVMVESKLEPKYPLKILYSDEEVEVIHYEGEDCCGLYNFDSENSEDIVMVTDALGRKIKLKIENKLTVICELLE